MSEAVFQIKVITPAGVAVEEMACEAALPGPGGEIGILPGHRKYAALLESGVVRYTLPNDQHPCKLLISEGVCCFSDEVLSIVCLQVETPESVAAVPGEGEKQAWLRIMGEGHCEDPERVEAAARLRRLSQIEKLLENSHST